MNKNINGLVKAALSELGTILLIAMITFPIYLFWNSTAPSLVEPTSLVYHIDYMIMFNLSMILHLVKAMLDSEFEVS